MFSNGSLIQENTDGGLTATVIKEMNKPSGKKSPEELYSAFMKFLLNDFGSYVFAFTGPRGGGKTLSMSYIASQALEFGVPVWSNYPINGRNGHQAILLDKKALLSMATDMQYGLVCIDEAQFLGDSRRPGSVANLLFGYLFMQIRKNALSVLYSVKDMGWIDSRVRWETDLAIDCRDACRTPLGKAKGIQKGEVIYMNMRDLSGQLTGKRYDETGKIYYMTLCPGHEVWPRYDTSQQVDILEAMAGVEMNLTKVRIGDERKDEEREAVKNAIAGVLISVKEQGRMTEIRAVDLWDKLNQAGIEGEPKMLGQFLSSLGVVKHHRAKGDVYDLAGVDTTRDFNKEMAWGGE